MRCNYVGGVPVHHIIKNINRKLNTNIVTYAYIYIYIQMLK